MTHHHDKTVLLTLGRLPVSLHLARAMRSQGWRVIVAEPFAQHLCRLSNTVDRSIRVTAPTVDAEAYLSQLHKIIVEQKISLVLPVSEESIFAADLKPGLPETVQMLCMNKSQLLQLHDKYEFAQLAEQLGVPVPQTVLGSDVAGVDESTKMRFVVKPRLSCSGAGVRFGDEQTRSDDGDQLNEQEKTSKYVVQKRLDGKACCSFSIAHEGVCVHSVCYRSLLESGSVSVCFEQMPIPEGVATSINAIVKATRYTGMISFDFICNEQGKWCAIECNPRATSGLHFLEYQELHDALIHKQAVPQKDRVNRAQEFWSCLLLIEGQLFKGKLNRAGWKYLFSTRDINWQLNDAKPFLLMSFILAPMLFRAFRQSRQISELLMQDVGWHEL